MSRFTLFKGCFLLTVAAEEAAASPATSSLPPRLTVLTAARLRSDCTTLRLDSLES